MKHFFRKRSAPYASACAATPLPLLRAARIAFSILRDAALSAVYPTAASFTALATAIFALLSGFAPPVGARPTLPNPPVGTASASFAGGGAAHAGGVAALFVNPAALSIPDPFQLETGLMGLSEGTSPYALFGARAGEVSSYAFGYYFDSRAEGRQQPARAGLIAGASWEAWPEVSLGYTAHTVGAGGGAGLHGFGVDAGLGLLYRPNTLFRGGLALDNLLASGAGQKPEGYGTRRSYLASMGLETRGFRVLGLTFHDPDLYYELRAEDFPFMDFGQAFSLASSFTPEGRLGLRATVLMSHFGDPGMAISLFLNLPAGGINVLCGYTFDTGTGDSLMGEYGPTHSLSVNLRLGRVRLTDRPSVWVRADRIRAPVDSNGAVAIFFRVSAREGGALSEPPSAAGAEAALNPLRYLDQDSLVMDPDPGRSMGRIRAWNLTLHAIGADGKAGAEVRRFEGRDLPPRVIRWDGLDGAGRRQKPGFYSFSLWAEDVHGNSSRTSPQILEITPQGAADPLGDLLHLKAVNPLPDSTSGNAIDSVFQDSNPASPH